jgi:DNA-binding protein Fis
MIADLDAELFKQAIALANGNQAKAARWLGVTRTKMRETLAALGLHPSQPASEDDPESEPASE